MKSGFVIFFTVVGFLVAYFNAKKELRQMENTDGIPSSPVFYGMVGGALGLIISGVLALSYPG